MQWAGMTQQRGPAGAFNVKETVIEIVEGMEVIDSGFKTRQVTSCLLFGAGFDA